LPFYNVRTQYSGIEFLSVCVFKLKPALFAQKQGASPWFTNIYLKLIDNLLVSGLLIARGRERKNPELPLICQPKGDEMLAVYAPVYAILVGIAMIGQWSFSYLSKQIPELESEPIRITFHIAGEIITALCLVLGGIGLLMDLSWGRSLYLVAMGMLFYTVIVSPGYFAQKGDWKWLGIFGSLIVVGLISILAVA
jgi:hypothetical protein